jgi:hypothetical protein
MFTIAIEKMSIKQNKYANSWKPFSLLVSFIVPRPPGGPGIRQGLRILTSLSQFWSTVHRRRRRRCRCTMFKIAMSASRGPCLRCRHCRLLSPVWAHAILNQRVTSALLALTALDHIDRASDRELGAKVLGRRCVSTFYAWSRSRRPRHKEDYYSSLVG